MQRSSHNFYSKSKVQRDTANRNAVQRDISPLDISPQAGPPGHGYLLPDIWGYADLPPTWGIIALEKISRGRGRCYWVLTHACQTHFNTECKFDLLLFFLCDSIDQKRTAISTAYVAKSETLSLSHYHITHKSFISTG